ncbi:kinesin-like protein KIF6 [Tubulanus polymorphus]|uniref:kinesin-like protein KIF6 n=1 Tax=Tubulanus polymorphus TaxID=672921 RepID=UPI003DA3C448
MVKQTIQIFARLKPTKQKTGVYDLDEDSEGNPRLQFFVPRVSSEGLVNNKKEKYKFRFEKVFDRNTKQDSIFEHVAKPVLDNVLAGYNGTIFAYGQTGSGKTFTITGGPEKYEDRGIIPRVLSYMYQEFQKKPDWEFTAQISYLEIYNEFGYDLLNPEHECTKLEDLPKVKLMEDSDQNIHLRNMSMHQANNEEDALNLLFTGDTNRMIAETPMNQASTRSHCIFTIHISSREHGSATIRRSKLHLVDLAGSERVSKTGAGGQLLTEAKYINVSLHFLEQVIVALSEKGRTHIPYRNSMMTSVLRDSLGGNCMTTMIATCSVEKRNIDESISTCRFAQRVALIKNDALLNEELDPQLVIVRLKKEIQQLKEELAIATGEQRTDELTEEDMKFCEDAVKQYLDDNDPEAVVSVGMDVRKMRYCHKILKRMVKTRPEPSKDDTEKTVDTKPVDNSYLNDAELSKLKVLVTQRDNEINILVNMLKKEKKRAADAIQQLGQTQPGNSHVRKNSIDNQLQKTPSAEDFGKQNGRSSASSSTGVSRTSSLTKLDDHTKNRILGDLSKGRQEAFDIFRRDYENNENIADTKHILKQRYAEAKELGAKVNNSRQRINHIKGLIEQHRMSRIMEGQVDPDNYEADDDENQMRAEIETCKETYKSGFTHLKTLKTEIEHLQHLLEKAKVKMMKDFEMWWAEQVSQNQANQSKSGQLPPARSKSAWRTPPLTPSQQSRLPSQPLSMSSSMASISSEASTYSLSSYRNLSKPPLPKPAGNTANPSLESTRSSIPMTGDPRADADIMAFVKARQNILRQANGNR